MQIFISKTEIVQIFYLLLSSQLPHGVLHEIKILEKERKTFLSVVNYNKRVTDILQGQSYKLQITTDKVIS